MGNQILIPNSLNGNTCSCSQHIQQQLFAKETSWIQTQANHPTRGPLIRKIIKLHQNFITDILKPTFSKGSLKLTIFGQNVFKQACL